MINNNKMEKLSAVIRASAESHPTNTYLRSEDLVMEEDYKSIMTEKPSRSFVSIPNIFDGRKVWGSLLCPVMNQGRCGSCWAFASTSVLSDRFNIQSMGLMSIQLSPTKLILCDWQGVELSRKYIKDSTKTNIKVLKTAACSGNSLYDAWRYMFIVGVPTIECVPYDKKLGALQQYKSLGDFTKSYELPLCQTVSGPIGDLCSTKYVHDETLNDKLVEVARFYKAFGIYSVPGVEKDGGSEKHIRYDIYNWGPVSTGIRIYQDFYTFNPLTEIYEWDGIGEQISGHAIEITGWGIQNGVKYWQVKNSWGKEWGDKGYFKIIRGNNNCGIEENVITGIPDYFYPEGYILNTSENVTGNKTNFSKQRTKNASLKGIGGGIELTTGYTRRSKITYPWIDFNRPVELADLPDNNTFVAGRDTSIENRIRYKTKINTKNNLNTKIEKSLIFYIVAMCVLISFLIFIITKYIFKSV
jgi:cathepsin B